jgi:hypothetical protein
VKPDPRPRLRIGSLALCALLGGCHFVVCNFDGLSLFDFGDAAPAVEGLCSDDPSEGESTCDVGTTAPCVCRDGSQHTRSCGPSGLFAHCPCGPDDGGVPDVPDVSPGPVPPADPRTYDFVLYRFVVDRGAEPPSNRGFYGFNLDGRFSPITVSAQAAGDCSHGDYFSTVDPDQNRNGCTGGPGCQGGVDNQYPNVAQTLEQFRLSTGVGSCLSRRTSLGRGLILLRVADVDGMLGPDLDDPAVTVSLYPDARPLFAECASLAQPRQPYAVDNQHLTTAGDPGSARLRFTGSIVRGRLRVAAPATSALPFALGFGGTSQVRAPQLRMSLTETAGTSGNLGGYIRQTELVETLVATPALTQFRDALGPLIQGFVDVATPGDDGGLSCDSPEGGIGIGVGFEAVRATILATTSGPMPGMCGSYATASAP